MLFVEKRNYYNCIICGIKIMRLDSTSDTLNDEYNKGIVTAIRMLSGSRFKGDDFIIGLCDDCIEHMINDKIIKRINK